MGEDIGYGMGWKLQAGSITPVWASPTQFSHYIYTDATGAEYSLSLNNNNVWTSQEGVYVRLRQLFNRTVISSHRTVNLTRLSGK